MRVAVLTLADPWAQTDGGTLRTRALLDALRVAGHHVVAVHPRSSEVAPPPWLEFVPVLSEPPGERHSKGRLGDIKRHYLPMPTSLGARSPHIVDALRRLDDVDVLVVSQLSAAGYAAELSRARLWLDQSDVWSTFAARSASQRRGLARLTATGQAHLLARREAQVASGAAVVTAAGWTDANLLSARVSRPVPWLPTPVSAPSVTDRPRGGRPVAGLIGNFGFAPNADALEVLLESWAPQLRAQGWDIVIAGHQSDRLDVPDWMHVLGPVGSVADFYAAIDLALAPIRLGGGMKVKVVEALMHRRPVLASAFAMDGFPPALQRAVTIWGVDPTSPQREPVPQLELPADVAELLHPFTPEGFATAVRSLLAV